MTRIEVSRRSLLTTGVYALAGAMSLQGRAKASAMEAQSLTNEELVRKWYAAWEKRDWAPLDSLLGDNFTFSSAAGDDHISKSTFKSRCWETQIDFIKHFDLERVNTGRDDAFVKYLCTQRTASRSGTWSISKSGMGSCNRSSVISASNPAFLLQ
jgi:hypothetical protein